MIGWEGGYAVVNGLRMYYERKGSGAALVLLHGGGSTLDTSFGRIAPLLARRREVIAVDLRGHGRSGDRPGDSSFAEDADEVVGLLDQLGIGRADLLGFSNGSTTALQVAIRHPARVRRLVLGSALAKRSGMPGEFWDFMNDAQLAHMPQALQDAYRAVAPDPAGLQRMHDLDAGRMQRFEDIPDAQLANITAPALVLNGDREVVQCAHALELRDLLGARLAILPGGHGDYLGEVTTPLNEALLSYTTFLIDHFLTEEATAV